MIVAREPGFLPRLRSHIPQKRRFLIGYRRFFRIFAHENINLNMYTLNFKVTPTYCDTKKRLSFNGMLQMMQDTDELWLTSEPSIIDYFEENGMAQVLVSRQVDVIRVPSYGENLTVTSRVYEMKGVTGFRNTVIYDLQGDACYMSWSQGAFIDRKTGRLHRVSDEAIASMSNDQRVNMEYLDRRIDIPDIAPAILPPIEIRRHDIDYNLHVNNTVYVRFALELLSDDFEVERMRVEHKTPAHFGDTLTPHVVDADNRKIITLMIGDKPSAVIEFTQKQ